MTQYGKITSYDSDRGTGMIAPQDGTEALPFRKTDLQQHGEEPRSDQVYTFETQRGPDGAPQAVNVQMEQGTGASQPGGGDGGFNAQGQSEMTVNEQAARRSGVDGAGGARHGTEEYDSQGRSEHQTRTDGQEGVSRGGMETARGNAPGETRADRGGTSAGGSTFQPLEAESSKDHRSTERQHELGRDSQGHDERAQNEQRRDDRRT